ncbi:MAG: CapA family protein [Clostridia bacterium]|nr:CapA family protein [Clostridia bacterium]
MRRKRRGISAGTLFMLLATCAVLGGTLWVLRTLEGDHPMDLRLAEQVGSITLKGLTPELSVEDIPLISEGEEKQAPQEANSQRAQIAIVTEPPRGGEIDLTFAGTIALETNVRQSGYYSDSKRYDFSDILSLIAPDIRSDYAFAPVENLIVPSAQVSDLIAPAELTGMLVSGQLDGIGFGFSKAYDKTYDGLSDTVLHAQSAGLDVFGAYRNEGEAGISAQIRQIGNVKVAFLHYTESLSTTGSKAVRKDGRTYAIPLLERAEQDIPIARSLGADLVVVTVNWGTAGKTEVTKTQKSVAQRLAAAGADLIVGNGPRRVQTLEKLELTLDGGVKHTTLCAYSLGCLLSSSTKAGALQSMLLHVHAKVDAQGAVSLSATYTPTFLWRYKQESLVRFRVIAANGQVPDGMSEDQQKKMTAAASGVAGIVKDAPITVR